MGTMRDGTWAEGDQAHLTVIPCVGCRLPRLWVYGEGFSTLRGCQHWCQWGKGAILTAGFVVKVPGPFWEVPWVLHRCGCGMQVRGVREECEEQGGRGGASSRCIAGPIFYDRVSAGRAGGAV